MNSCSLQNCTQKEREEMKMSRIKKRITAMMMVSVLSLWFASPDVAHAQTVSIEGRSVHTNLTANSSSVTATIYYTEGSGQVWARAKGDAYNLLDRNEVALVIGPENSNPTPGGVSASVGVPDGWRFRYAYSECRYELYINGTTYTGSISDKMDL